jgi:hypothetical protein
MSKNKLGNVIKVVGVLTFVGTMLSKLVPVLQAEHPKLKKKVSHIGTLLTELKDEIVDLGSAVQKTTTKKK